MKAKNFHGDQCEVEWGGPKSQPTLRAQLTPDMQVVTILGWVKKKNDGRWTWWRCAKNDFFTPALKDGPVQGVVATEAEAKKKLEEVWGVK